MGSVTVTSSPTCNVEGASWEPIQPLQAHGRSLHVRQESLEPGAVLGVDPAGEVDVESRVGPGSHALDGFGADLSASEHQGDEALAEEGFESTEVELIHGEVHAVGSKEAERADGVGVGVVGEEVAVACLLYTSDAADE